MLRIENVEVFGLKKSIIASGYPMSIDNIDDYNENRAFHLGSCESGSGHDCYLKGIIVEMDVIFPEYWSPQFQRYHFADIISSQSKMHRIVKFDIKSNCNKYVDDEVIKIVEKYKDLYNKTKNRNTSYFYFMKIISNLPMGFEKRMRIVTNYLQLKTIYKQRKSHKLIEDWGNFCKWILTLPMFKQLTGIK